MAGFAISGVKHKSPLQRYGVALLVSAAAILLRRLLTPVVGPHLPYTASWLAIIFSVWYCGTAASMLATLTSLFGVWYLILPPVNSFAFQDAKRQGTSLAAFLLVSGFVIALGEAHRRSRSTLENEIKERMRVEQALREADRDLREAQRLAQMGSWRWDSQSNVVTWSEGMYRIAGRDPKLPAPGYDELAIRYKPESWQRLQVAIEKAVQTGEGYHLELEMIRADGGTIRVITHAEPQRDASGRVVGLIGSLQDITASKRAELELRLSSERFQVALHGSPITVFNQDRELRFTWIYNPTYGYNVSEIIGKTDADISERAEDARATMEIKREVIRSGVSRRQEVAFRHQGMDRWYDMVVVPMKDEGGSIVGITCATIDITDRRLVETALRNNEERLRIAQRAGHSGTFERNFKTNQVYSSPELREIYGLDPSADASRRELWRQLVHPDDLAEVDRATSKVIQAGATDFRVEFRITRGDGVFRWIESTAKVFYDEDGSAERIVAVCTDITERKQAEDALRASEGRLRFIADRARAGLWDWDLASGRLEWSPLCKQLFGIPLEETMSYERFLAAVHPEDRDLTDRTNRGYLEGSGGGDYDMEYRVVLPDGAIRWIHAKGSATFEDGKPQRMAGIVLDVTDRKQSQDALRQNEERLRLAHQAAHSGAWEVDVRTREIFWSPELQTLWGLVPGATVDIRGTIRRMIISDDYAAVDKALADVLENRTRDYRCLYRMIRPDGALRWNESFGEVIRDDRGSVIRIVGVTIDITERKQAEEALRRSHLELEHKVEERTRALAASLVSLESEVIVRRQAEEALQGLSARLLRLQDEERRRIARDLHDSTGQTLAALKMTIASLEELVRNVPQAPQIIRDLNAFAEDALKDIRTTSHLLHPPLLDEVGFTSAARWYVDELAKRSGIQIRLELTAAAGGLTKSSELAFFRVLQESLTNVIRHSGSAAVDIRLQGGPDNATLTIQDYGRGIPSDMLNHFQETGAGVGVGLGGMKQRIRELGGQLEVSSDPTGTCVRAVLPTTNAPAGTRQDGRTGDSAPAA